MLQHYSRVYSRISALSATANRPKTMLNWPMFVQIERGVSLLVLNYSRTYTQSPAPVQGWVSVKTRMPEPIPGYQHARFEISIEHHLIAF